VWQVAYTADARAQRLTLPPNAARALDAAVEQLQDDPWQGRAYRAGYPPEYRLLPFGGWGLVVYLIREPRGAVVLLEVTWAGT
jgi:plasmid stabilization system protein ParE